MSTLQTARRGQEDASLTDKQAQQYITTHVRKRLYNLLTRGGHPAPRQIVIVGIDGSEVFFSYGVVIALKRPSEDGRPIVLDSHYWNYSRTTLEYLRQFLSDGRSTKDIEQGIKDGVFLARDLNS